TVTAGLLFAGAVALGQFAATFSVHWVIGAVMLLILAIVEAWRTAPLRVRSLALAYIPFGRRQRA
ncbi:hypothetical protein, partial [Streptomyces goshikiensis]